MDQKNSDMLALSGQESETRSCSYANDKGRTKSVNRNKAGSGRDVFTGLDFTGSIC